MTAFDPAAWLARFEQVGGWYAISGERVAFGWLESAPAPDWEESKRLCAEIQDSDHRERVVAHVRQRCLIR